MLLALPSAVFLGSKSLGTRDHILLSQIWDFPLRRLLRLAESRWRYSTPPLHGFFCLSHSSCLQDNPSARTTRKTVAPLLRVRLLGMETQKTSYVIVTSLAEWRADCCLTRNNNIRNSIVVCVYPVPRCLPVRCLAIHVTIFCILCGHHKIEISWPNPWVIARVRCRICAIRMYIGRT
jgi:hypothetical protein